MNTVIDRWKQKAHSLKKETFAIYLAYKDPRVPWYAKLLAACVVGYALSPIDLIPDPIPILGYLDDLVLVPLGIALVVRLIPPDILEECRQKAETAFRRGKPKNWIAGAIIISIWIIVFAITTFYLVKLLKT
ncbi:MAG: YkvA family protein [Thermodesulfobacteriota bacterium]